MLCNSNELQVKNVLIYWLQYEIFGLKPISNKNIINLVATENKEAVKDILGCVGVCMKSLSLSLSLSHPLIELLES